MEGAGKGCAVFFEGPVHREGATDVEYSVIPLPFIVHVPYLILVSSLPERTYVESALNLTENTLCIRRA
jgi:hypothetical protein